MVANYYTLLHVARDLDERLKEKPFQEIFSQNKNELLMQFSEDAVLVIGCDPSQNHVYLRHSFSRAKKNSMNFFPSLISHKVQSVSLSMTDREIIFKTPGHSLILQMFGSKANIFLLENDYKIRESFLKPRQFIGTAYKPGGTANLGFANESELRECLKQYQTLPLKSALKKTFPRFGNELCLELIHRAGLLPDAFLSDADVKPIFHAHVALLSALMVSPSPRIYYQENTPKVFSIIALNHLQQLRAEQFESVHEALHTFIARQQRDRQFSTMKVELSDALAREFERLNKPLDKLKEESEPFRRAIDYETFGKLLMANLDRLKKGLKTVEVSNVFGNPPANVEISLEPGLTPAQNAQRYFDKARRARLSQKESESRKVVLEQKLQATRILLDEFESVETSEDFQEFVNLHGDQLVQIGIRINKGGKKSLEERLPFRVFTVSGGFQVWVGKSSENNDLLTMKHAKPEDLWFHTRGSSGSHVVLKIGSGKGEPSKHAIHQAAAIAAYYSKMRNSKTVPVAMTRKKYVRKSRGATAGTVTIEREKVLFVEPGLPE